VEVKLAARVAQQLGELPRQRRGALVLRLRERAGRTGDGLVTVRTPHDIAACEASSAADLLLVYAVLPKRDLVVMLWGVEIDRRRLAHETRRLLRGISGR
jgi:hypothetical protein